MRNNIRIAAHLTSLPVSHERVKYVYVRVQDPKSNRTLLLRRAESDTNPGMWEMPGGKREPGETLTEAAHRELREEARLSPKIDTHNRTYFKTDRGEYGVVFQGTLAEKAPRLSEDHDKAAWATRDQINNLPGTKVHKEFTKQLDHLDEQRSSRTAATTITPTDYPKPDNEQPIIPQRNKEKSGTNPYPPLIAPAATLHNQDGTPFQATDPAFKGYEERLTHTPTGRDEHMLRQAAPLQKHRKPKLKPTIKNDRRPTAPKGDKLAKTEPLSKRSRKAVLKDGPINKKILKQRDVFLSAMGLRPWEALAALVLEDETPGQPGLGEIAFTDLSYPTSLHSLGLGDLDHSASYPGLKVHRLMREIIERLDVDDTHQITLQTKKRGIIRASASTLSAVERAVRSANLPILIKRNGTRLTYTKRKADITPQPVPGQRPNPAQTGQVTVTVNPPTIDPVSDLKKKLPQGSTVVQKGKTLQVTGPNTPQLQTALKDVAQLKAV